MIRNPRFFRVYAVVSGLVQLVIVEMSAARVSGFRV